MLKRLHRLTRKILAATKPDRIDLAGVVLMAMLLAYGLASGKVRATHFPNSAANAATLAPRPKGPVLQNTFEPAVSTPTDKRGSVTPKILGSGAPALPRMLMGGMAAAVTPGAWLVPCFEHPARPTCFKTRKADALIQPGIQTMTTLVTPAQAAPAPANAHEAALIQLHAAASNAATLARWYTARKQYPQAARKTRQHLAALRDLARLQASAATEGGAA